MATPALGRAIELSGDDAGIRLDEARPRRDQISQRAGAREDLEHQARRCREEEVEPRGDALALQQRGGSEEVAQRHAAVAPEERLAHRLACEVADGAHLPVLVEEQRVDGPEIDVDDLSNAWHRCTSFSYVLLRSSTSISGPSTRCSSTGAGQVRSVRDLAGRGEPGAPRGRRRRDAARCRHAAEEPSASPRGTASSSRHRRARLEVASAALTGSDRDGERASSGRMPRGGSVRPARASPSAPATRSRGSPAGARPSSPRQRRSPTPWPPARSATRGRSSVRCA